MDWLTIVSMSSSVKKCVNISIGDSDNVKVGPTLPINGKIVTPSKTEYHTVDVWRDTEDVAICDVFSVGIDGVDCNCGVEGWE